MSSLDSGGDRPALLTFREGTASEITYRELDTMARRLAGGLRRHGVETGEQVAIFAPNGPEWIAARLGLLMAGAVAVSLDSDLTPEALGLQLGDCEARRIFTVSQRLGTLEEAGGDGLEVWLLDPGSQDSRSWENLMDEPVDALPDLSGDDIVSLFYTSGTTGPPKGVPLTHANIACNIEALKAQRLVSPGDRVLMPLPLYHSYPFIVGMMLPLAAGATIVLPSGVSGPEIGQALREGEVDIVVGVPRLYESLAEGLVGRLRGGGVPGRVLLGLLRLSGFLRRRAGLRWGRTLLRPLHRRVAPRLRLLASGGARLDPEVGWTLEAMGWMVLSGYGLVETSSISTFNPPGRARMESAGLPAPGVQVRIADTDQSGNGEVQIKGPHLFAGYRNRPEANAEAFTEDGWFRTGDLGHLDEEGYLYIVGRSKEMIVLPDGKNIAPEEVEAVYAASPYIRELAVLEESGRLVALVVPDFEALRGAGGRVEDQIRIALAEQSPRLPAYQRISDWRLTREKLPRTQLGKYQRHKLPDIYARAGRGEDSEPGVWSESDAALLEGARARAVWDWLEKRFPRRRLHPDTSPQLDLGIDSLEWVSLGMEIEREFGLALSEEAIARTMTLRDLIREIEAAPQLSGEHERNRREAESVDAWLAPQGAVTRIGAAVLHLAVRAACRVLFRVKAIGLERVPSEGPLVIAPNHVSDIDPVVLAAVLPSRLRGKVAWGADRGRLFGNAPGRLLARLARLFPVDDRRPGASLAAAVRVLEKGDILVWFPEEWRSPDGKLQRFLPGIGKILKETGASVVPCYIDGAFEAMPRHARLPRPRPVTIRFGAPLALSELATDEDEPAALADRLKNRVAELIPEKP